LATAFAANEEGAGTDATGSQNGNSAGNKINFDRNLVNVCINSNGNDQSKVSPPGTAFLNTANVYLNESTVHLEPNFFRYIEVLCDDGDFVLNGGYFLRQSCTIGDEQVSLDRPKLVLVNFLTANQDQDGQYKEESLEDKGVTSQFQPFALTTHQHIFPNFFFIHFWFLTNSY